MAKDDIPGWTKTGRGLGGGGQAQVHVVIRNPDTDRKQYALKVFKQDDRESQAYGRFCREIEALKSLNHPNIIKIIDHSSPDWIGKPYYVMEYIEGAESLKKLMKSRTNPYHNDEIRSCQLFIEIASALEACEANEPTIIHRDLGPGNILVLPNHQIKIIDFGICHIFDAEPVTRPDENLGTLNYRAPECSPHNDAPWSISTDLYSAGKILWAAMTNRGVCEREEPIFADCSMRKMYEDDPNKWHLQKIFEGTIRQKQSDRWKTAAHARVLAERVLDLMKTRTLPVEELRDLCPICRWGKLWDQFETVTPAGTVAGFVRSLPPGVIVKRCNHCGYWLTMDRSAGAQGKPEPIVKINSPKRDQQLPMHKVPIQFDMSYPPEEGKVLVFTQKGTDWWAHDDPITRKENTNIYDVLVGIGVDGRITIHIAVVADEAAIDLINYYKKVSKTKWIPMSKLPGGVRSLKSVEVVMVKK